MQLQALYVYGVFNVTNAIGNYAISKSLRGS